jgi:FAD:protein FMN transferase
MPLTETLPLGPGIAQWSVWSTIARIVVTDPAVLPRAEELVREVLDAVDAAASRFRPDSEVSRLHHAGAGVFTVSPLLAELIETALVAARSTDGDVDPTVGSAMVANGYDRDIADLDHAGMAVRVSRSIPGWRWIHLAGCEVTLPAGLLLDLGATAKAWAADRCADLVANECGVGALVGLGGDIASAGTAPEGGWRVRVQDHPDDPQCTVAFPAGAVATSSTLSRTWPRGDQTMHHILDPYTCRPVRPVWRTATVFGSSCVDANTASTAALIRGERAPAWLRSRRMPARLIHVDGTVLTLGGWPTEEPVS